MGSVLSDCECPQCNWPHATLDYYYRSGEEYIMCGRCGSYFALTIVNRPESGEYPKDWKPKFESVKNKNKHAFSVGDKIMSCGGFKTTKDLNDWKDIVFHEIEIGKVKGAHYTYKSKGKWYTMNMVTSKVTLYDIDMGSHIA